MSAQKVKTAAVRSNRILGWGLGVLALGLYAAIALRWTWAS